MVHPQFHVHFPRSPLHILPYLTIPYLTLPYLRLHMKRPLDS